MIVFSDGSHDALVFDVAGFSSMPRMNLDGNCGNHQHGHFQKYSNSIHV
jgi:hypothetical protein